MIINILIWIMLVEADHSFPVRMIVDDPEMMMNYGFSYIYIVYIYIFRHIDSPPSLKAPHDQHTEVALLVREAVSDTSDNKKWVPSPFRPLGQLGQPCWITGTGTMGQRRLGMSSGTIHVGMGQSLLLPYWGNKHSLARYFGVH